MPWGSGGVPCQVQPGGVPSWGGTLPGGTLPGGGYPAGVGTLPRGGTLLGGYPAGGTQLGQHREYLLHGGRYASCVHAGGLSCLVKNFPKTIWKWKNLDSEGVPGAPLDPPMEMFFLNVTDNLLNFNCFGTNTVLHLLNALLAITQVSSTCWREFG